MQLVQGLGRFRGEVLLINQTRAGGGGQTAYWVLIKSMKDPEVLWSLL